jgi:RNA polymerase sigma-70 factor (ECF subfamily)
MESPAPEAVWRSWFETHGARLRLCARQWARTAADAEDLVQEAFVRYWRHQRHLPGEPLALIITSLRRAAQDRAREQDRRGARELAALGVGSSDEAAWFAGAATEGGRTEREEALEAAVRRLPPEQREVLVLKIWGELTFADIGAQLDLSPHTVASRYRYALAALRNGLTTDDSSHE